jgi:TonB family protein
MLVSATRTVSTFTLRALFYAALFGVVAAVHFAITTALREAGWNNGLSLTVSGAVVLGVVLLAVNIADYAREQRAAWREIQRMKQGLPSGPCCVVWRASESEGEAAMPWDVVGQLQARYPKLARRFGVEGYAVVDFEINAQGQAKNVHCIDAWPSDVFYEAAREALAHAKFTPKPDVHPRFGASFRMPFVFRIAGAARLKDRGRHAKTLRPTLKAAGEAVEKLRKSA